MPVATSCAPVRNHMVHFLRSLIPSIVAYIWLRLRHPIVELLKMPGHF